MKLLKLVKFVLQNFLLSDRTWYQKSQTGVPSQPLFPDSFPLLSIYSSYTLSQSSPLPRNSISFPLRIPLTLRLQSTQAGYICSNANKPDDQKSVLEPSRCGSALLLWLGTALLGGSAEMVGPLFSRMWVYCFLQSLGCEFVCGSIGRDNISSWTKDIVRPRNIEGDVLYSEGVRTCRGIEMVGEVVKGEYLFWVR